MSAIEPQRSQLALDPQTRYLPTTPARGYVVGGTETLAAALHRLTTEQFTIAIEALSDPRADVGIATTATLRSVRRIAAVLRLVRSVIGEESYRTELNVLTETDALLSRLQTGQPELRALDQVRARYDQLLRPSAFVHLRTQLHHRHQLGHLQALAEGEAMQRALHRLRRARARFAAWPLGQEGEANMYGREPVADSFESLANGLERTYARGRKHWKAARAGDIDATTKWHQQCRSLGHQLEIIRSSWPEVIGATADACGQLEAVLAEAQGMAALHAAVRSDAGLFVDRDERAMLDALVTHGRTELGEIATTLGARLYAESPRQFIVRMDAYWSARGIQPRWDTESVDQPAATS